MKLREQLQKTWIIDVLSDHPEVISESANATEVYSQLWEIWLVDVQIAMKDLCGEIKNTNGE